MKSEYRILMLEDELSDAELVLRELKKSSLSFQHKRVDNRDDFLLELESFNPDMILADSKLPTFDGLSALQIVRGRNLAIPFIFVSGSIGEEYAVETMRYGATDYVLKDKLYKLIPAINRAMEEFESDREKKDMAVELGLTRERLEFILANSPVVIYNCDAQADYMVKFISTNVSQLTGYEFHEYQNNPLLWRQCLHPDDALWVIKELETLVNRKILALEYRSQHKDGHYLWLHDEVKMLFTETGQPAEIVGFWVDITLRKQSEEKIQRQLKQINVLRNVEKAITSSLDMNIALHIILEQLIDVVGVNAASILLPRTQANILELAASMGFKTRHIAKMNIPFGVSFAGLCALERKTIYTLNLKKEAQDENLIDMVMEESFVTQCAIPLIAKGQLKGVLELFYRKEMVLDSEEMNFLEAIGSQAAVAIDNATMFQDSIRSNMELNTAYDATLEGWARAMEFRDAVSEGHIQKVCDFTIQLAKSININGPHLINIRRGALLHDIGKIAIPDSILLKPGTLNAEEWDKIRQHPVYAFDLLASISYLREALDIPYCHHEKWDGSGYPRGLKGDQIPIGARIFAIIDVWDALTSDRSYRKAWSEADARAYIAQQAGHHFDPALVERFLRILDEETKK
jgi:PAS domain S-box-containing protein